MKLMIITTITLTVGVGATYLLIRTKKRAARKPPMTFWELYEDNLYADCWLFD